MKKILLGLITTLYLVACGEKNDKTAITTPEVKNEK